MSTNEKSNKLLIVYDGECPFCTQYVQLLKLREVISTVELINAREGNSIVGDLFESGYDLNEGMVAIYENQTYYGADCVQVLALLSTGSGIFNRINSVIFRSKLLARILYPVLRIGRNLTLMLLGKRKITHIKPD
ncbi:MAG: DUF393 domain-containing protein [Gammaproteobacteria bacterium]|nr:DUF393 domain-containing protein [Gammaproteobacteria bacterium]